MNSLLANQTSRVIQSIGLLYSIICLRTKSIFLETDTVFWYLPFSSSKNRKSSTCTRIPLTSGQFCQKHISYLFKVSTSITEACRFVDVYIFPDEAKGDLKSRNHFIDIFINDNYSVTQTLAFANVRHTL